MDHLDILPSFRKVRRVGSQNIVGVTPNDSDFLVLCSRRESTLKRLEKLGYLVESGRESSYGAVFLKDFVSLRKNKINIILTSDKKFFLNFLMANKVCVDLQLTSREDRVKVHKTLLYTNPKDL